MAYNNDRYSDPYQQHQGQGQGQGQYASYDQSYPSDTYPANPQHDDTYSAHQQPEYYPSTDKINVNESEAYAPPVIERERKGRQNIGGGAEKSWANGPPPRSTGILRMWRKDERGKQWTRGGGMRTCVRMTCCCLTLAIIIILSIVLTIALYVRPPNVTLNNIDLGNNPVALTGSGLSIAFGVSLSVANPNWFSVNFETIKASVSYPGVSSSDLGGGQLNNVNFAGYTQSTFDFPLTFNYTLASDPNRVIINDLAQKCGTGGSDIKINYKLDLHLKVLGVSVKPTFSDSASFECPISSSQIEGIIGGQLGS